MDARSRWYPELVEGERLSLIEACAGGVEVKAPIGSVLDRMVLRDLTDNVRHYHIYVCRHKNESITVGSN